MAAAHDAGGAHRAAQTRVCSDPRTDRRWRFSLPDLGRPCLQGRSYRTAPRRDAWPRAQAEGDASGVVGMTPARANSGQAAKRPTAPTPQASLPLDAPVLSIVANLEGLDLNGLRRQWRAHLGGEAPAHLPRWLLMRVLAYRLQSDAFGDLDKSIRRILRSGKEDGVGAPFDRRAPQTREGSGLKAGAAVGARMERQARAGDDLGRGVRLEWPDLRQPIPDRQSDDRDHLERPSLLRPSSGKGFRSRRGRGSPKEQK